MFVALALARRENEQMIGWLCSGFGWFGRIEPLTQLKLREFFVCFYVFCVCFLESSSLSGNKRNGGRDQRHEG